MQVTKVDASIELSVEGRWLTTFVNTSSIGFKLLNDAGNKLGIVVKPGDVRLITTCDDLYTWRVVSGKEHLFKRDILKKHMSQHSIGAYRHLYNAVGHSVEAVARSEVPEESIGSPQFVRWRAFMMRQD